METSVNGSPSLVQDNTEIATSGDGPEMTPEVICLARKTIPGLKTVGEYEETHTVGPGACSENLVEQASAGECHIGTVGDTLTVARGGAHFSGLLTGPVGQHHGITIGSFTKNKVTDGVSVSYVGGERVRRIAEERFAKERDAQRQELRLTTPQESIREEPTKPSVGTSGLSPPGRQNQVQTQGGPSLGVSKGRDLETQPLNETERDNQVDVENQVCCGRMMKAINTCFRGVFSDSQPNFNCCNFSIF